ncbi:hypothetical protein [Thiohalocapsa marina]|uniref:hypothetical protein n=1 Tax=Thiohalocapsa marina TaxID=424902 RepID=UPI0036DE8693
MQTQSPLESLTAPLVESIHRLNRSYLHTVRDWLRAEPALAPALFGLDETLAAWLASADSEAIERLARMPGAVFQPRLPAEPLRLLAACTAAPAQPLPQLHLLLRQLSALGPDDRPEAA